MCAGEVGTHWIPQIPGECFLVRHLDQLDFERIAVSTVDDTVPCEEPATVIGQQCEYGVLEGSKIVSASCALPQQDAQAQRHEFILPPGATAACQPRGGRYLTVAPYPAPVHA